LSRQIYKYFKTQQLSSEAELIRIYRIIEFKEFRGVRGFREREEFGIWD